MNSITSVIFATGVLLAGTVLSFANNDSPKITVSSMATITPVVELYTSEGCSSCPPADRLLSKLGGLMDESFHAVPLAFHVDYWNWLGWHDPYSTEQFTKRQRLVAEHNNQRSIYTPEIVVGGKEARGGGVIYDWITRRNNQPSTVSIMLDVSSDSNALLQADLVLKSDAVNTNARIYVAIYENEIVRNITGGENRGKTLMHDYVVRYWSDPIVLQTGKSVESFNLTIGDDWVRKNLGIAVVAVNHQNGETLQAVHTPLTKLYL